MSIIENMKARQGTIEFLIGTYAGTDADRAGITDLINNGVFTAPIGRQICRSIKRKHQSMITPKQNKAILSTYIPIHNPTQTEKDTIKMNYANMRTTELRKLCREVIAPTRPSHENFSSWTRTAKKAECIGALIEHERATGTQIAQPTTPAPAPSTPAPSAPTSTNTNATGPAWNANPNPPANVQEALNVLLTANRPQLDPEQIKQIAGDVIKAEIDKVAEEIKKGLTKTITIQAPNTANPITIDGAHKKFDTLLKSVTAREAHAPDRTIPVMLSGPAGSGKTFSAEQVAKALGLPFYCVSISNQTTKTDLLGYLNPMKGISNKLTELVNLKKDPNAVITNSSTEADHVESLVFKAYTGGGVLILDEVDNGNGNTLNTINALTGGSIASFACGMVKRHKDFHLIVAGNTWGRGADHHYVGRNKLDEAFLNRFTKLAWDYDEQIEHKITGNLEWSTYVQKVRATMFSLKIQAVISPRQSIHGSALLNNGIDREEVEEMVLWGGLGADNTRKIKDVMEGGIA